MIRLRVTHCVVPIYNKPCFYESKGIMLVSDLLLEDRRIYLFGTWVYREVSTKSFEMGSIYPSLQIMLLLGNVHCTWSFWACFMEQTQLLKGQVLFGFELLCTFPSSVGTKSLQYPLL